MFSSDDVITFVSSRLFDEHRILRKDSSYPKISIVTPSFNQAEFIERTILSVLNQNYPNLEYILIDGGSTDGSIDIIKKYEKYFTFWVSEPDEGQTDAINKGFKVATGDLIGWQNSDDIYLPGAFKRVVEIFFKTNFIDILFGNLLFIDESDNIIRDLRFTPFSLITHIYEAMAISNQSVFWRRDLFSQIGLLDTRLHFSMDYEFFLRAKMGGAKFKNDRYFFGGYRIHGEAKSEKIPWVEYRENDLILKSYGGKSTFKVLLRVLSLIRRSFYYLIQGDLEYVLRGLKKRIKHIYISQ